MQLHVPILVGEVQMKYYLKKLETINRARTLRQYPNDLSVPLGIWAKRAAEDYILTMDYHAQGWHPLFALVDDNGMEFLFEIHMTQPRPIFSVYRMGDSND